MRVLTVLVCCSPLLVACGGGGDTPAKGPERYDEPVRTVRPDEHAVTGTPRPSGEIEYKVLGVTSGIKSIAGSHIEVPSVNGQDVRVRIVVVNTGRTTFLMKIASQLLVTSDGRSFPPDQTLMTIKRQPLEPEIGSAVRLEFDLWWDIPAGVTPQTLKLVGTSPYSVKDPPTADFPLA